MRLEIVTYLQQAFGPVLTEWKYYGKASGWIQKHGLQVDTDWEEILRVVPC